MVVSQNGLLITKGNEIPDLHSLVQETNCCIINLTENPESCHTPNPTPRFSQPHTRTALSSSNNSGMCGPHTPHRFVKFK
ncbi:hypothetical protein DPMN_018979 [Dreissena polymorpha]|uniref:Uncharacterized protein n=1 Tax=Dreissena polymorpha TaxID=45954 RepID=A0A9D4NIB6_DREPO|nr:hypothetical protein DPMN_018979 [Dreissena polymorpha]